MDTDYIRAPPMGPYGPNRQRPSGHKFKAFMLPLIALGLTIILGLQIYFISVADFNQPKV